MRVAWGHDQGHAARQHAPQGRTRERYGAVKLGADNMLTVLAATYQGHAVEVRETVVYIERHVVRVLLIHCFVVISIDLRCRQTDRGKHGTKTMLSLPAPLLLSTPNLHAQGVARVRALAGHW